MRTCASVVFCSKLKAMNSSMVAGYAVKKAVRGESMYLVTSTECLLCDYAYICHPQDH